MLYVSGEESETQIKLRAQRLGVTTDNLLLLCETDLSQVLEAAETVKPDVLIADSVQTLCDGENASTPGSVSQVKACTMALMQLAKGSGVTSLWWAMSTRTEPSPAPESWSIWWTASST